ncbi:hypothetical protein GCM10010447_51400 [Streptomyces fulvorobeus]|uniref:hypothetical protein n=1 Tax=Streptomyces fulvorobeus TaxID=284028 RepID=UPI0031E05BBB
MDSEKGILLHVPSEEEEHRAFDIFDRLIQKAGTGKHRLTLTVAGINGTAIAEFTYLLTGDVMAGSLNRASRFCELLAVAVSGKHHSGLVLRTQDETERVCGWRFQEGDPLPLNRAEVFDAYCHNPLTGEVVAPEPGIEHADAPVIHI